MTEDGLAQDAYCARHLHDGVIQRLFGAGLSLRSTLVCIADPAARDRVRQSLGVLDEVIEDIRVVLHTGPTCVDGETRLPQPAATGPGGHRTAV